MIDTHCHINISPLLEQASDVLERAKNAGVTHCIVVGTSLSDSQTAIDISKHYPNCKAAVGLHPENIKDIGDLDMLSNQLSTLAQNKEVVAIGECGLDYTLKDFDRTAQRRLFGVHIQIAKQIGLPLVIHCRDRESILAYDDLIDTLEHFSKDDGQTPPFVLHCVSGPKEYIQKAIAMGAYVSFAGNVTYPSAQNIRDILPLVPKNKLLAETDAPFLAPQSVRGSTNEPAFVKETVEKLAELLHLPFNEVDRQTTLNAKILFRI
ncbi:MAG TPA: TatD family hydrolase [Patescibacteria group bacterium]|nr:TatD family hydrolase [Patescibacteria group bacterium]